MTKIISFYLPQFHEIPENNEWWGNGFTEWTNVRKAQKKYDWQIQPKIPLDNNYYDLTNIHIHKWQIELAKEHGIYGFILPDKKFRIRDKLTEAAGAADDARRIKRGKVCETWYRPDLIDVMYEIGIPEPRGMFPDFQENQRLQLAGSLVQRRINKPYEELQTWPLAKLVWYFKWYNANSIKRDTICQIIKDYMAATGRLLT